MGMWRFFKWFHESRLIGVFLILSVMVGMSLFTIQIIWPNAIPILADNPHYTNWIIYFCGGVFIFTYIVDFRMVAIGASAEKISKEVDFRFNDAAKFIRRKIEEEKNEEKKQELEQQALELRQEYESRMSENLRRKDGTFVEDWREVLLVARKRLSDEEQRLLIGNAINRRMGVLMAFAGVFLPAYYIFSGKEVVASVGFGAFFSTYWPFFTIVIIFEIVAIFYLRLYTQTLRRIEKNKNELTNVELRLTAGLMLCDEKDSVKLKLLADELSKEERNFVLDKNESSAILDTDKIIEIVSKFTPKIGT